MTKNWFPLGLAFHVSLHWWELECEKVWKITDFHQASRTSSRHRRRCRTFKLPPKRECVHILLSLNTNTPVSIVSTNYMHVLRWFQSDSLPSFEWDAAEKLHCRRRLHALLQRTNAWIPIHKDWRQRPRPRSSFIFLLFNFPLSVRG